jgi:hypothetical protein
VVLVDVRDEANSGAVVLSNFALDVRRCTATTALSGGITDSWQVPTFMYRCASLTLHACCSHSRLSLSPSKLATGRDGATPTQLTPWDRLLTFAFLLLTARASAVTRHCLRLGDNMHPTSTFPLMDLDTTTSPTHLFSSSFTALNLTQLTICGIQAESSRLNRSRHGGRRTLHL